MDREHVPEWMFPPFSDRKWPITLFPPKCSGQGSPPLVALGAPGKGLREKRELNGTVTSMRVYTTECGGIAIPLFGQVQTVAYFCAFFFGATGDFMRHWMGSRSRCGKPSRRRSRFALPESAWSRRQHFRRIGTEDLTPIFQEPANDGVVKMLKRRANEVVTQLPR